MIDWLTIVIALIIIVCLIGGFGFLAWKISMSDPLARDESHPSMDDKRRKEKNANEQSKKKRKDQKKWKRETKDDGEKQSQRKKPAQISEETDDEREESEQELLNAPVQPVETSSKARKRNKNKARSTTPPPPSSSENQQKNSNAIRAPPVTHPKSAPKDEQQLTKQPTKGQTSNKQTLPTPVINKKPTQKQQQQQQQEDQTFTVVGGNRHKNPTPPVQQNKPQTSSTVPVVQQYSTVPVHHEQLAQRLPEKETPAPTTVPTVKQSSPPPKIADLIKVLPSSQVVVTELMSALDAFPLSPDELDIIMHKIANKQSVVKQDWNKLQQGQKVDPQAHIGQVLDESAKAYEDDLKTNSVKRIKELTTELQAEKRRNNDFLKEKLEKEREIQILHAQLDSTAHKTESSSKLPHSQQRLQTLELQVQRLTEDNMHLTQQLTHQTASNFSNTTDATNLKVQVLSEQIKKLSVDNANWEKKAHSNDLLAKEAQQEKEDLIRYNEQLTQSLQKVEKDLKHIEEKHHQQLNDLRTTNFNDINEYKNRIQQLENENEQLKREEIVHVEPSTTTDIQTIHINNEEREQLENEIQQLKQTIEDIQQKKNHEEQNELNSLRTELSDTKSILSRSEDRLRQQRQILTDLLAENLRQQLPNDNQDSDQWLSTYRQVSELNKQESEALKRENAQLQKNMSEIENQLREIESTVQSKEETLLNDLKDKDAIVEKLRQENAQLKNEFEHLQSISEARALKHQLDERFLLAANSPSIVAADESFELVKQLSPSQSPIVIDMRAEQLNELIRSSKEALENQDSVTQQLDKHLNDMHHSGIGEKSIVDDTTVSTSSNPQ